MTTRPPEWYEPSVPASSFCDFTPENPAFEDYGTDWASTGQLEDGRLDFVLGASGSADEEFFVRRNLDVLAPLPDGAEVDAEEGHAEGSARLRSRPGVWEGTDIADARLVAGEGAGNDFTVALAGWMRRKQPQDGEGQFTGPYDVAVQFQIGDCAKEANGSYSQFAYFACSANEGEPLRNVGYAQKGVWLRWDDGDVFADGESGASLPVFSAGDEVTLRLSFPPNQDPDALGVLSVSCPARDLPDDGPPILSTSIPPHAVLYVRISACFLKAMRCSARYAGRTKSARKT
jgi:hypothetical protein